MTRSYTPCRTFFVAVATITALGLRADALQAPVPPMSESRPAPPPVVPTSRLFTSGAGIMFSLIKPDKTADFEWVMTRVKEGLANSKNPKRRQQANGWRVFRALESGAQPGVLYIWLIEPTNKELDYTVSDIITEAFPSEAQDIWQKYVQCFVQGQVMLNMQETTKMSSTPK